MQKLIDEKCRSLYTGKSPVMDELCYCILLGKETVDQLEGPLEATWKSQFSFVDHFIPIRVTEQFEVNDVVDIFQESLQENSVSRLKIEVVALMADPIFGQEDLTQQIEEFCEVVKGIRLDYGLNVLVEFIGVLEARKRSGYNYSNAFRVISAGYPSCWKYVYHVERGILERDFSRVCHCIANKMLIELPEHSVQLPDGDQDYAWSSLWIEEQQVSGSILCMALLESYEEALRSVEGSRRDSRISAKSYQSMAESILFRSDAKEILNRGKFYLPRICSDEPNLMERGVHDFIRQNCMSDGLFETLCLEIVKDLVAHLNSGVSQRQAVSDLNDAGNELEEILKIKLRELGNLDVKNEDVYLGLIFEETVLETVLDSLNQILHWLDKDPDYLNQLRQREIDRLEKERNELKSLRQKVYSLAVDGMNTDFSIAPIELFQQQRQLLEHIEPEQIRSSVKRYLRGNADQIVRSLNSQVEREMANAVRIGIGMGVDFKTWKCCLIHPTTIVSVSDLDIRRSEMVREDSIRIIAGKQWSSYKNLTKYC